jgi:hypothetical protein
MPAKKKGTGSRGVPHRLNSDERVLFDLARRKGYLEVVGSGWRSQRRDAPLVNTYRSLCDARGQVAIVLHKKAAAAGGLDVLLDRVVVDLSPLRLPQESLKYVAAKILEQCYDGPNGVGRVLGDEIDVDEQDPEEILANDDSATQLDDGEDVDENMEEDANKLVSASDPTRTRPIYQLPAFFLEWELPRPEAKALGKTLAAVFGTAESPEKGSKKKPVGVKPGKNRRSGGYGIG